MGCLRSIKFICSADLKVQLDINYIAMFGENTELKKNTDYVTIRSRKLGATARVYKSGKLVCVGGQTRLQAKQLARQISRRIQKLNNPSIKFRRFAVINIVSTIDIGQDINLEKFTLKNQFSTFYEPELHPWAESYILEPQLTFLVYSSGKIMMCGGKNLNDLHIGCLRLKQMLC